MEDTYAEFDREDVDIVDIGETPIAEMKPKGIMTSDRKWCKLDVIIFATGFDASGRQLYARVRIHGRGGERMKEHWAPRPASYLGCCVPSYRVSS
jgi:cyclohexanone monooxygenase